MTIESYLTEWLSSGRRSSPNTAEAYRRDVLAFIAFTGHKPVATITAADVTSYQALLRQKYQPASEYRKLASIRSFFKFLKVSKVIVENPAETIEGPRTDVKFKEKVVTEDEVLSMIEAARGTRSDSLLLRLLYISSGRISEILALSWNRFTETEEGGARVQIAGKGRRNREVYLPPSLWADLAAMRAGAEDDALLFPISRQEAHRIIKRIARAAKVTSDVSAHWFRHSSATHGLERGATLAQVRDQLGHADVKMTSRYVHADPENSLSKVLRIG